MSCLKASLKYLMYMAEDEEARGPEESIRRPPRRLQPVPERHRYLKSREGIDPLHQHADVHQVQMTQVHLPDAAGPRHAVVRPISEALGVGRRRLAILVERMRKRNEEDMETKET